MTALILEFLDKAWPFILASVGILFGVFGLKAKNTAQAKTAQVQQQAAVQVAQANSATVAAETAVATVAETVKVSNDVQTDVAKLPDGAAAEQLRNGWARDGDSATGSGSH